MSEKIETPKDEVSGLDYEDPSPLDGVDVLGAADELDRALPGSTPIIILLLTIAVSGAVFVITAVYFIFVFAAYGWSWNGSTRIITTGAPYRSLSTILMVVSHVVNFSVVVGTTLHVYSVCAMWLKLSKGARGTGNVDTSDVGVRQQAAAQLDLLVSVLKSGGLGTWVKACFRLVFIRKSSRSPTYRLVVSAVSVAGILLFLSYVSTVFELWLNDSTYGTYAFLYTDDTTAATGFGRQVNQAQCNYYATNFVTAWEAQYQYMEQLCGLSYAVPDSLGGGVDGMDFPSAGEGSRILSNSSSQNNIAYTDDQHAILIDGPATVSYTATTLGVQSSCQSITKACLPGWSGGGVGWDCSQSGQNVIVTVTTTGGIVNPDNGTVGTVPGTETAYNLISSNAFRTAQLVQSYAYTIQNNNSFNYEFEYGFVGDTGFAWSGIGYNVVLCNVIVHDVEFGYTPYNQNDENADDEGTYVTLNYSPSSTSTTRLVANAVDYSFLWTAGVASRVDGIGLRFGNYIASYGLELSKELVAYAAAAYQPVDAITVTGVDQPYGSEIPLAPMILYFLTVVFYGVFTLWIGIRAYRATAGNPDVQRAHMRLTQPLTALEHLDGASKSRVSHNTAERTGTSTAARMTRKASSRIAGELFDYMTGSI